MHLKYPITLISLLIISSLLLLPIVDVEANPQKSISQLKLPQHFEQNLGQYDSSYQFVAHNRNSYFAYAPEHIAISLAGDNLDHQLIMKFIGGDKKAKLQGENKRQHVINYLRGNSNQTLKNIATYTQIRYREVYPGIDVQFYFNDMLMEYDFIVKPYVDTQQISIGFEHADSISVNNSGQLVISFGNKTLIQRAPVSYQLVNGKRVSVKSHYSLKDNTVGIVLASYDKSLPLVIDPIIEFSSYFGGEWEDQASEIETDSEGNIWVAGATATKTRITYQNEMTLENTALSTLEDANTVHLFDDLHGVGLPNDFKDDGVTVDIDSNTKYTIVDGVREDTEFNYDCRYNYQGTFSNDRIITDYDAFLTKFNPQMEPIFTTYFGGCGNDGVRDMVIDDNDNVYLVGFTLSEDFPVKFPAQSTLAASRFESEADAIQADSFYAKFDNDGGQVYTSYLGGNGRDGARGVAVDADENVYITGYTHSNNLATTPCTGGTQETIACENIGGVDETAVNQGSNDISLYADAFIAKIKKDGDVIEFLTYFGGEYDDWGQSIVLQSDGVVVAGNSASSDLPVGVAGDYSYMAKNQNFEEINNKQVEKPCSRLKTEEFLDLRQADAHVCEDVFLTKLSLDGTVVQFTTYLGGDKDDNISDLKVDSNDNLYLIGTTRSQGVQLVDGKPETIENSPLNDRYPLYKHIKKYNFDINSLYTIAFFTIFNPGATELLMSSFIGAEDDDAGIVLAINEKSINEVDVFFGGHTVSQNFYTSNAFQSQSANSDVFLVKITLALDKFSEPYSIDPENPGGCNKDGCDLYELKYSTLMGGESLDSLKGMSYSPLENQLLLTGSTFSTKFLITSNALKSEIEEITEIEYDPFTREIIDQYNYYPADTFIMMIKDLDEFVDLEIALTNTLADEVKEDSFVTYNLNISNNSSSVEAKSVRLIVNFPQISVKEKLGNYVKYDLDECVLELRYLYCVIGNLPAGEEKAITINISARNSGSFVTDFNVMSLTADDDVKNNTINTRVQVKSKSSSAQLSVIFLMLLLVFPLYRKLF